MARVVSDPFVLDCGSNRNTLLSRKCQQLLACLEEPPMKMNSRQVNQLRVADRTNLTEIISMSSDP